MHLGSGQLGCLGAARRWPVWEYPRSVVAYIVTVIAGYGVAVVVASATASFSTHDLILFGGLLACSAATVELTRRMGENAGLTSHIYGVWEFPAAILLSPIFALTVAIPRVALTQLRIRQMPLHRRVFTTAAVGLSYGACSLVFHAIGPGAGWPSVSLFHGPLWVLAVAAAAVAQWAVNLSLLLPAIKGSDPAVRLREVVLTREVALNDVTELCVAVLVTFAISVNALTMVFALPFVTLLQRSLRHNQLVNASRIDSKTGLLNAGTWEREATAEVARAVRTRTPLALALVDIDHFKGVNDTFGHLVGDRALKAVARTFQLFLREYDLIGRFGGEEFALLLPHTSALDAYGIAERIRDHIAVSPLDMGDLPDGRHVRVTVSVGVAALGAPWDALTGSQITDLLAAADRALYRAKRAGRNQVCVVADDTVVNSPEQAGRLRPA
ncbi:MAG TPA: GGDEF domain-containing protein [Streptosporangiaceae bacterium]|jgi:diguanylate cyclase (GGDEF)-like protein